MGLIFKDDLHDRSTEKRTSLVILSAAKDLIARSFKVRLCQGR
jgi:hypothetical protein